VTAPERLVVDDEVSLPAPMTQPVTDATRPVPRARAPRAPSRAARLAQRLYPLVLVACFVPAGWLTWETLTGQLLGDIPKILEHETGEFTMRFLAATLAVTPLRSYLGWSWLQPYRKLLGNMTFLYATLHLLVFFVIDIELSVAELWTGIAERPYITVGMLAWLLMVPLAITSLRRVARAMGGARWKRLHQLTYVVALAGTTHYLWAVKKDTFWPVLYFAIFAVLLAMRLPALRRLLRRQH
jgi:sulfoxide reductase heme-binding subunit YedZ